MAFGRAESGLSFAGDYGRVEQYFFKKIRGQHIGKNIPARQPSSQLDNYCNSSRASTFWVLVTAHARTTLIRRAGLLLVTRLPLVRLALLGALSRANLL